MGRRRKVVDSTTPIILAYLAANAPRMCRDNEVVGNSPECAACCAVVGESCRLSKELR